VYASTGGNNKIRVFDVGADRKLTEQAPIALGPVVTTPSGRAPYPVGLAISADGTRLVVANQLDDSISVLTLAADGHALVGTPTKLPVGHNPYGVAFSRDGGTIYASNQGGNTVSVRGAVTKEITVGTHPSALALNPARNELYVANGDSDSISVIDT